MSRQFRAYLMPADVDALTQELNRRAGMKIFQECSPTATLVELESPLVGHSSRWWTKAPVSSVRCYLASAAARMEVNYYERPNHWVIQPSSEAIEFSGCDFDGATLVIGRLYFQTDLLIDGTIFSKRPEFLKWSDDVFRYTKKSLRRDTDLDAYVGEHAENFRTQGGRFASMVRSNGEPIYEPAPVTESGNSR